MRVGVSIPGDGSRTVIFTRDYSTLAAVRINGTESSNNPRIIVFIIEHLLRLVMSNTMNIEIIPDDTGFQSTKVILNRREQNNITRYYCIQTEDDEKLKKPLQNCSDQNDEKCIQLRFITEYLLHV